MTSWSHFATGAGWVQSDNVPRRGHPSASLFQRSHSAGRIGVQTNKVGKSTIYLFNFTVIINTRLWIDLFHAINNAKKLIYITGWSVFTQVKRASRIRKYCGFAFFQISLIRGDEAENCDDSNVGELLKRKAAEGVILMKLVREVYILIFRCVF